MNGILHGASAAAVALTVAMVVQTGQQMPRRADPGRAFRRGVRPQRRAAVAAAGVTGDRRAARPVWAWPRVARLKVGSPRDREHLCAAGRAFGGLSLMSIGGGNVVLPEMHLRAVRDHHWLSDSQFADIFAISQAAPGAEHPDRHARRLRGRTQVGGVPGGIIGGLVATAAMVIPAAGVVFVVTQFWQRAQRSRWRIAVEKGFAPMTVGLILAASLVMSRTADRLAGVCAHGRLHADIRVHRAQPAAGGRRCRRDRVFRHASETRAGSL